MTNFTFASGLMAPPCFRQVRTGFRTLTLNYSTCSVTPNVERGSIHSTTTVCIKTSLSPLLSDMRQATGGLELVSAAKVHDEPEASDCDVVAEVVRGQATMLHTPLGLPGHEVISPLFHAPIHHQSLES